MCLHLKYINFSNAQFGGYKVAAVAGMSGERGNSFHDIIINY
jgi:hypothetical protein